MPTPDRNAQVFFRSSPLHYDDLQFALAAWKTPVLRCPPITGGGIDGPAGNTHPTGEGTAGPVHDCAGLVDGGTMDGPGLAFRLELGRPWLIIPHRWPVYILPPLFLVWWCEFDTYAPSASARGAWIVVPAELLGEDGVVLGKYRRAYLRHYDPEHVMTFGPTRTGNEVDISPNISGGANLLLQLVNARYGMGSMILISNRGANGVTCPAIPSSQPCSSFVSCTMSSSCRSREPVIGFVSMGPAAPDVSIILHHI